MAPDVVTCPLQRVALAGLVASFAFAEETSVTVNAESFLEIVTEKIAGMDSKVDSVLRACGNERNGRAVDPKTENRICSMSSRIIEMESEIDGLKLSAAVPSSGGWSSSVPEKNILDMISNLESDVKALQTSFESEKSRTIEVEQRVQELSDAISSQSLDSKSEAGSQSCKFKEFGGKKLVKHLLRATSTIFLEKPSNASSVFDSSTFNQVVNGLDGDFTSQYHSKQQSNPWFLVDLKVPHFIWEIQIILRETFRASGIQIYISNDVTFLEHSKIVVNPDQMFGHQTGNTLGKNVIFRSPDGMCGRYVIVYRAIQNEFLVFMEIQGTGYGFE